MDDADDLMFGAAAQRASDQLGAELWNARRKFPPINSLHEGYGVICEEVKEFFDEVCLQAENRSKERTRKELLHIAVTAIRTAIDLGLMEQDL